MNQITVAPEALRQRFTEIGLGRDVIECRQFVRQLLDGRCHCFRRGDNFTPSSFLAPPLPPQALFLDDLVEPSDWKD